MTVDVKEVARYYNKVVSINVDTGVDSEGNQTFTTYEGKVIVASDAGIILRHRSNTVIIDLRSILDLEEAGRPRKRRIVIRYVRVVSDEDSAKQHLADRHGILVSVLNAVDEDTAREMHRGIEHKDLGHRHGDRPTRRIEDLDGESGGVDNSDLSGRPEAADEIEDSDELDDEVDLATA